jgi:hypothetical protein
MVRERILSIMRLLRPIYDRSFRIPGVLHSATPELLQLLNSFPPASGLDRQHELEGGTEVGIRGCPEPPAVRFHD